MPNSPTSAELMRRIDEVRQQLERDYTPPTEFAVRIPPGFRVWMDEAEPINTEAFNLLTYYQEHHHGHPTA